MAKVHWLGATYTDVPAVSLPDGDGGVSVFYEGGGGTLITKTITENGTYSAQDDDADGYSEVTVNVSGGGGEVEPGDVTFIDYDGTVLYSYTAAEALALTELPANPSHSGLTAQGWNWTLSDAKAQLTAMPAVGLTIGQIYRPTDGKTHYYITFPSGIPSDRRVFAIRFSQTVSQGVTVDWGDGTTPQTYTGTSAETRSHAYANPGDYEITLNVTSGTATIEADPEVVSSSTPLGFSARARVKKIHVGDGISALGSNTFRTCYNLKAVTVPNGVTLNTSLFYYCSGLKFFAIPSGTAKVWNGMFRYCYSLERVSIPKSATQFDQNGMASCYNLASITIPATVTQLGSTLFYRGYGQTHMYVPASVSSIAAQAFQDCSAMKEYHFLSSTPPSLASTDAFSGIPSDCKIYVPYSADHSVLNAYKTATNWSTYASYMVEEDAA